MSRPRSTGSVSLFPFLAVLVCAMGALIFLLVVTTRQIRSDAIARAQESEARPIDLPPPSAASDEPPALPLLAAAPLDPQPVEPAPIDPNIELQARLARRDDEAAAARAALARRQAELRAIRANQQELEADVQAADARLRQVSGERRTQAASLATLIGAQRAIEDEIQNLAGRIAAVRQESPQAASRFALVPYDGRSGTARRPILIECNADGMRFLPEDVLIAEQDLEGFMVEYNPVLAAAEALFEFWAAHDRLSARGEGPSDPYFLLIVRPGGARSFYAAQKILGRDAGRFGYELLDDDFPLALPEVDPRAQTICRREVARLLAERTRMLAAFRDSRAPFGDSPSSPRDAPVIRGGARTEGIGGAGDAYPPAAIDSRRTPAGTGDAPPRRRTDGAWSASPATDRGGAWDEAAVPRGGGGEAAAPGREFETGGERAAGGPRRNPPDFRPSAVGEEERPLMQPGGGHRDGFRSLPSTGQARGDSRGEGERSVRGGGDAAHGLSAPGQAQPNARDERGLSPTWGGNARRGNIGLEKEVVVEVLDDRLIVGRDLLVPIDPASSNREISDELIEAIERHVASWGEPPAKFYWAPRVRFRVSQGANRQYERIRGPVERLGVSTSAEFVLESEQGGKAR